MQGALHDTKNMWRNLSLFSILDLHGVPDNLDQKVQYIDDFVNKLIAIKNASNKFVVSLW